MSWGGVGENKDMKHVNIFQAEKPKRKNLEV